MFQRDRHWLNPIAHPRWVEAPMLEALAYLLAAGRRRRSVAAPILGAPGIDVVKVTAGFGA